MADAPASGPSASTARAGVSPWVVAPTVGLAAFMEVLDISIANVALQHIAGSLSASQDESTWVLTSYLVTNAIVLPMSGWLSSTIGRKRYFLGCIVGFSITSLLCGRPRSLWLLILARGLQGITGGGLQPTAQAILADAFPPEKRGQAFAAYGIAVVFAPAIGPTLGGWITDNFHWRWVFLLNVPVGMFLTVLAMRVLTETPEQIARRKARLKAGINLDYVGFAIMLLMPVVGNLVARVDPRWLIAFGLGVTSFALFRMTSFDLDVDYATVAWARVYQSLGLAFLFIPINTVAFLGLPPEKSNNASAIINMMRNLGGSFGIAIATTLLARRQQYHQSVLVEHVTPYSSQYDQTIQAMQQAFAATTGNAADALQKAQALLYATVQKQAPMLSYIDSFWVMGVSFIALVPLLFLMKKPQP